jgi:uncharacterized metal-binding protein YceD (DUF177 family)
MSPERPWSVPLRFNEVGNGVRRRLEPDEAARARIAAFLDLAALERLTADLEIAPEGEGTRIRGHFEADVIYTCGVTVETFPAKVAADFAVSVVPADKTSQEAVGEVEIDLDSADPPDVVEGGVIELGGYVVEHLALELDPFPRKPGAEFEPPPEEREESPFAKLAAFKPRTSE